MALPRSLHRAGPTMLCAAAGAAAYNLSCYLNDSTTSRCDVPSWPPVPPAPATAVTVMTLRRWLERHQGADVSAIDFKPSSTDAGRFGMFASPQIVKKASRGFWGSLKSALTLGQAGRATTISLASFPLEGAITAHSVLSTTPGEQAAILRELAELGLVDERTLVMLHLMVERLKGRDSPLCPWIRLLPGSFSTTLYFSQEELQWLRGTTLHRASQLRDKALQQQWRRLAPACQQLALRAGVEAQPSYQDFLWAYSIFWSRAISIPCRTPTGLTSEEGVLPGLDFANHDPRSAVRWTVWGTKDRPGNKPPSHLQLVCPRNRAPRPGDEMCISYGDKSNEELLFNYGFAVQDNPDDVLHVPCPIPQPEDWDDKMQDRMQLLSLRGLKPQVFLPATFLSKAQRGHRVQHGKARGGGIGPAGAERALCAGLPEGVFDTLEVFTMEGKQLKEELEGWQRGDAAQAAAGSRRGELTAVERSGLRMAVLTTLMRLLEMKVLQQEGEEGTGTLESDQRLLEAAEGRGKLSDVERYALLYRMGQKRLTREYLMYVRGLLDEEMRQLKGLMGMEG